MSYFIHFRYEKEKSQANPIKGLDINGQDSYPTIKIPETSENAAVVVVQLVHKENYEDNKVISSPNQLFVKADKRAIDSSEPRGIEIISTENSDGTKNL